MLRLRHNHIIVLSLLFLTLCTSGCWDRKEIENRGYVLGIAIDHVPSGEGKEIDQAPQSAGERKYRVTVEMPKFRKSESSKEVSTSQSHFLWSGEGESIFAIMRMLGNKVYFAPFFEDTQVIIISESVAREGIANVLDFFTRDAEMRWRMNLVVASERAESILSAKLKVEETNSIFLSKLMRNESKSPYFAGKAEIGKVAKAMRRNRSIAVPIVMLGDQEVRLGRAALINSKHKMVGELTEREVMAAKLLRRTLEQGIIVVPNPANPQATAVFEIYETNVKVNPQVQNNKPLFVLEAKLTGTLGENMVIEQDSLDPDFTAKVEKAVASQLQQDVEAAFRKLQQLETDVCELGDLLDRQQPQYWKQVKERWDEEVFPDSQLVTAISVEIRRPVITR